MKKLFFQVAALAGLIVLCVPGGCVEYSTYCSNKIDCEGGNDKDKSACADAVESEEDQAKDYGCSDQFEALASCAIDGASCIAGRYKTQANCDNQETALQTCIKNATGKKQ